MYSFFRLFCSSVLCYSFRMRIFAEKMVAGGKCIGRQNGKTVFVRGMLPGETAEAVCTVQKKDFDEGEAVEILDPSPHRVEPLCPCAASCGGCDLMAADYAFQLTLKQDILRDLLRRFKCGYHGPVEVLSGSPWEYRSRFQFHKTPADKNGKQAVGFCARSSCKVTPVRDCPVAVPGIRQLLRTGELARQADGLPKDRFHVFSYGGKTAVESAVPEKNRFTLRLSGKPVSFDIRSFFQSNVPLLEKTAETAFADIPPDDAGNFLDLYAGCGVFSVLVHGRSAFRNLFLVEENPVSVSASKVNLRAAAESSPRRKVSPHFFCMRDSSWVKTPAAQETFSAAVLDPPRSGAGRATIQWLAGAKIGRLLYLSCDAPTFARDTAMLSAGGWKLDRLLLCDFYPQTSRMETLGFFSRTEPGRT